MFRILILCFVFFNLVAGMGQCLVRPNRKINRTSATAHLFFSLFQVLYVFSNRIDRALPLSVSALLAATFISRYYYRLFEKKPGKGHTLAGFLTPCLLLVLAPGTAVSRELSSEILWFITCATGSFLYLLVILDTVRDINTTMEGNRRSRQLFFISLTVIFLWFLADTICFLLALSCRFDVFNASLIYFNTVSVLLFFFSIRYPRFFKIVEVPSVPVKVSMSRITGIESSQAIRRLKYIMEEKRIFMREDLTLPKLARLTGLKTYQLSEILNRELNSNFNTFVNTYRIEEVKKQLENSPELSILEIALNCGFRSKTTFNKAFREITGHIPRQYRKKESQTSAQL